MTANTTTSARPAASGGQKPTPSKRRAGTLAKMACVGCRRLKMKCITEAEGSPCLRCIKAKRPCLPPLTRHDSKNVTPPVTPLQTPALSSDGTIESPWTVGSNSHRRSMSRSYTAPTLQTLHWSSPPSSVGKSSYASGSTPVGLGMSFDQHSPCTVARPRDEQHSAAPSIVSDNSINYDAISPEELRHLVQFFTSNLVSQVLVISDDDINDLTALIEHKRPLAISMAYVAAHFVPGCKSIRARLTPAAVSLATLQVNNRDKNSSSDEDRWCTLQSLAVLYTWASFQTQDVAFNGRIELTREMLRISIESLAVRYTMHSSAQEVGEILKNASSQNEVCQSFALRKYIFWLWLFTEAHLRSLVTRSPATLREDSSITRASSILEHVLSNRHIQRVVALVELCLIWVRTDLRRRDLGEWYCSTPNRLSSDTMTTMLNEMDDNLVKWRLRWLQPPNSTFGNQPLSGTLSEANLSLYQHFIHFCNAIYIAQAFRASSIADSDPASITLFEAQALNRAVTFCKYFTELNPLSKSLIGYSSETLFAMIGFCCDYITQGRTAEASVCANNRNDGPSIVLDVAELMIEVGLDDSHSARTIGQRILSDYLSRKAPPFDMRRASSHDGCTPSMQQCSNSSDIISIPPLTGDGSLESGCDSGHASGSQSPDCDATFIFKPWDNANLGQCNVMDIGGDLTSDAMMDMLPTVGIYDNIPMTHSLHDETSWMNRSSPFY